MALTLTEGNKYSRTELQAAVIDRLVKDSRVLELLPFETILGNSLTYNTITTDSSAAFRAVGGTWTENTPSLTQATASLSILGGDADVDNFLLKTRSNITDLKGTVIGNKVKAVQNAYIDKFFYGYNTGDPNEFDGLQYLISNTTYNTIQSATDANGAAMTVAKLRQMIDLITGWKPTVLVMPKTAKRLLSTYLDSVGSAFPRSANEFGKMAESFDGIEIVVDDHMTITESTTSAGIYSDSTSDDQFSVFALAFDPMAVCGIHSGDGVQIEPLGNLETKDAQRWRIKWYCGLMFQDLRSSSKYIGCLSGSAVTA